VPLPRVVLWPSRASIFLTWRSRPRDSARAIVVEVGGPRRRHRRRTGRPLAVCRRPISTGRTCAPLPWSPREAHRTVRPT